MMETFNSDFDTCITIGLKNRYLMGMEERGQHNLSVTICQESLLKIPISL